MNDQTNYIVIKAMQMLISKSKAIQEYHLLNGANEWIEKYRWKKDDISKNLWIDHNVIKSEILKNKIEEDIYKAACDEYQEITSLLFT